AHGAPLATPSQDMVLGIYYLTYAPEDVSKLDPSKLEKKPHPFRTAQEAELAYERGIVGLHDYAEYRRRGHEHFLTTVGRIIFNDRVERALAEALEDRWNPDSYEFVNRALVKKDINALISDLVEEHGAASIAQALDAFKELGFHFSTQAGITISKTEVISPPTKEEILERYEKEAASLEEQYDE